MEESISSKRIRAKLIKNKLSKYPVNRGGLKACTYLKIGLFYDLKFRPGAASFETTWIMNQIFSVVVTINSTPTKVWTTLTDIKLMSKWLGEPEMNIEVETDWKINSSITIRGFHHAKFENKGVILQYDKENKLSYSHLSSVSRLADKQENYTTIEFVLIPVDGHTQLTLNIKNFPTETIQKHLEFYWRTTILTIKRLTENGTTIR